MASFDERERVYGDDDLVAEERGEEREACGESGCVAYCARIDHLCGCDCSFVCGEEYEEPVW